MLLVTTCLMLAACGSSDDEAADNGTAPKIASLQLMPTEATVGVATPFTGTFMFDDPDGDVVEFGGRVTVPSGAVQELLPAKVPTASGVKVGNGQVSVSITPNDAGTFKLEVWAVDAKKNQSNVLSSTFEGLEPMTN